MNIEIPILHKSELTNRRVKVQDWGVEWCGGVVLDIVAVYHDMQKQKNLMMQTWENRLRPQPGPFWAILTRFVQIEVFFFENRALSLLKTYLRLI